MKRNQKEGVSLKETEKSNYDQVIENWRLKFLEMDQEKLTRKFHLEADEEALYIVYFSRKLRIDRKSGVITDQGVHPGFDTVMNIYNTFYYASEHPVASGNLVAFRQVSFRGCLPKNYHFQTADHLFRENTGTENGM